MNANFDFDRHAEAWLADGPTELADRVLDAALREVHLTHQRRRWSTPRRISLVMPGFARAWAPIAVLAAVVGAGAIYITGAGGPDRVRPTDTPPPGPTIEVTPLPTIALDTWVTYTSEQYGFTIAHPPTWTEEPAIRDWTFEDDAVLDPLSPAMDSFMHGSGQIRVSIWSIPGETLPGGPGEAIGSVESIYAWAEEFCRRTGNSPCDGVEERAIPMCLEYRDCHPATMVLFDDDVQAFFSGGGSADPFNDVYVIAVWRPDGHPSAAEFGSTRLLLQAFLSTVNGGGNSGVWPMGYLPGGPAVLGTQAPASP
jgi:hypothetical protein